MEFTIIRSEFLRGLKLAQGIADRKAAMPMLANVLLRTQGKGKLVVAATDLNVSLTAELKSTNASDGGITLGAKNLHELIANAPGDEVTLKAGDGHHAEFRSGKAKYKLLGLSDRDFPKIPDPAKAKLVPMDLAVLREIIDRTAYAVSTDDARYNMCGVHVTHDGKTCRATATDGHRVVTIERAASGPTVKGIIIPRNGIAAIRKLADGPGDMTIGVDGHTLFTSADGITVAVKLIDAAYPDVATMLASIKGDNTLTVDRAQVIDSLRRVQVMTSELRGVRLTMGGDTLRLSSDNPDMGEISDEIAAEYDGDPLAVGFNVRLLVDALGSMTADQVTVTLGTELDPARIVPLGDARHTCIVMPMRL